MKTTSSQARHRFQSKVRSVIGIVSLVAMVFPGILYHVQADLAVVPPGATVATKTVEEWTAAWWQWAVALAPPDDPFTDTTGEFANVNQSGPVFFLAGSPGGSRSRRFQVPSDKYVLVPLLAGEWSQLELGFDQTAAQIRQAAAEQANQINSLHAVLDGVPIPPATLFTHRFASPDFDFVAVAGNSVNVPAGHSGIAVADGYFLMLAPMSPGTYVLNYGGGSSAFGISIDETDTITVVEPTAPVITTQPLSQTVYAGQDVSFSVTASGYPLNYQWRKDGVDIPGATRAAYDLGPAQTHQAGNYTVVVTNSVGSVTSAPPAVLTVDVIVAATRYVDVNNSHPQSPYTNWSTAATTIQQAIDVAIVGDHILVTNGIYQVGGRIAPAVGGTTRVVVTKPVVVRSVNGPRVTAIDGGAAVRCAWLTDGATLSGFTLTNGVADEGAGVWSASWSATVSNCVVAGNTALAGGGAFGGKLLNCNVMANTASAYGGGVTAAELYDCLLEFNKAGNGGAASGSTLNRCLIRTNTASSATEPAFGGGANYGTLNQCTLVGNTATYGGGAATATLNNCVLAGNSAYGGGGASEGYLNNCTVISNSATIGGGAFLGLLANCIVYYNQAEAGLNYDGWGLEYCCTTPMLEGGVGNITNAPLFIDLAGGQLRLQPGSPCINRGNNAAVFGMLDLDGRPRVTGDIVDIGAYEFQSGVSGEFIGWLSHHGLPTDGSADYSDADHDHLNNWQEWRADTDPTDAASRLRMFAPTRSIAGVTVRWQSVDTRTYFLERSAKFGEPMGFSLLQTNITGQAGETGFTDTHSVDSSSFFYRVGVQ